MPDPPQENDGELTLAFTLEAFEALADPADAFADARDWSDHVGVVADDAQAVEAAVARAGVVQDYELAEVDAQSALSRLKWEAETDRYVLVGTGTDDRELAEYVNWEYRLLEEAAAQAGWRLVADLGPLERAWAAVRRLAPDG